MSQQTNEAATVDARAVSLAARAAEVDNKHAAEAADVIADLAELFKADAMDKASVRAFKDEYLRDVLGAVPQGKATEWDADAKRADARARQWLARAKRSAGIEADANKARGKDKAATKKGADQKGKKAEQTATPQAAWDRLQMAALELSDPKARAACQKSLANVAKHLNLDSGE